jgi:hypothetical protein
MKKLLLYLTISVFFNILNAQTVDLDIKVFLEGPFNIDQMDTNLNSQGLLPYNQPYNKIPWNYYGDENANVFPVNTVDWIVVEILEEPVDSVSRFFKVKAKKAGLLLSDGTITDVNGSGSLTVDSDLTGFRVRVLHRNHLPITSSVLITENNGLYSWDFTSSWEKAVGGRSAQTEVGPGIWAMKAADGNSSLQIDNKDKNEIWLQQNGSSGYLEGDYNMDGIVNEDDINTKWNGNVGYGNNTVRTSQVLKVCSENGRYFCKGNKAVFLTGSHTWDTFQDIGIPFYYMDYINWVVGMDHNFIKLWIWETPHGTDWSTQPDLDIYPVAYAVVNDKFDVTQLNQTFFDRLTERIQIADDNGLYVALMLFQGFSVEHGPIAWNYHPFNSTNNINGINVDRYAVHTNQDPDVVAAQRLYIRAVVDLVNINGFDNVLYEIGNEIEYSPESNQWHNDMIDFIHNYEYETYGVRRPVGKTYQFDYGSNDYLFDSPADWISPNSVGGYDCRDGDAPIANGDKVIINDTDHLYYAYYKTMGHPVDLVWKSFTGGINACHMDLWGGGNNLPGRLHGWPSYTSYNLIRFNMGYAKLLSERIDMVSMTPHPELSSTGFCLASSDVYTVYFPETTSVATVDLSASNGQFSVEWIDAYSGNITIDTDITAGTNQQFSSPYGNYSILVLQKNE